MVSKTQKTLNRMAEEMRNQESHQDIVCPYCKHTQYHEVVCHHVSYWGDDSCTTLDCEECNKEFQVEEFVERTFTTTTMEWVKEEDKRLKRVFKKWQKENKK